MIKVFILLIILPIVASSISEPESVSVVRLKWEEEKSSYRMTLKERAGVYYSTTKHSKCILNSLRKRKPATITYNLNSLTLESCSPTK